MMPLLFTTPELEPLLVLAQELMRHVYAEESQPEIISWLLAQVQKLSASGGADARLLWPDSFPVYEQIMAQRTADALLPESERKLLTWPWQSWRNLIDPLDPGMLAVLAAGDGGGKTLYAECLAEHWAKAGRQVVFLHFELNRALMLDRRTVRHTGIPRRALKDGKLTPEQESRRQIANKSLQTWPGGITYVHAPGWTTERALSEVNACIGEGLCDVFVVDYLEKAAPSPRQSKTYGTNIYAREADDVEQIKSFAEQHEIPALLLAQLNKIGKGQQFQNLDRTAIRGAGEKTEKANIVVLLHRETTESTLVQVRIDKNTVGPTGSFTQYLDAPRFRVEDVAELRGERQAT
jgi:replicative DNA helicase